MDYSMNALALMWLSQADSLRENAKKKLLDKYGSYEAAFQHFGETDKKIVGETNYAALSKAHEEGLLAIPRKLMALDAHVLIRNETGYPKRLYPIQSPPDVLYTLGQIDDTPAVAIVGSRHDTRYGREQAFKIARQLAESGVTVISGLARGIDTAAHKGALSIGGKTIAVIGTGIDIVYPPENKELAAQIVACGGGLVTEYAPGAQPMPYHFPLRNRIISGLSDGVLLIEATMRSGTMSTINHALQQQRPIFALPGNVDSPGSELPLRLLKDGAAMCTCADDILYALHLEKKSAPVQTTQEQDAPDNPEDALILRALSLEDKTFEELLSETKIDASDLSAELSMLELDGRVKKHAGRSYSIVRN